MSDKRIVLELPLDPAYVQTARLVTASAANLCGFDMETVEDLRVCISEVLNAYISEDEISDTKMSLIFTYENNALRITSPLSEALRESEDMSMGRLIIDSLMDEVEESKDTLTLVKYR